MSSSATTADYTSQTKGALKLKGGVPPISKPNRHKKKKKKVDVELEPEPEKEIQREDEEEEEEERGEEREKEERGEEGEKDVMRGKTAAEVRHEERRRKKLNERLKREGIKTHKERVEELNRYLSNLSEHHDMPRIGPG